MNTNKMMSDSLRIAKSLAPIDSGNLRNNAIKLLRRKNGFTIKYSGIDANYIQFVNDGTSKQKAQHFVENAYYTLVNYFANVEDNNMEANSNTNKYAQQKINMEVYRDNPDYRRLVHTRSIFQHYQNEGKFNKDGTQQLYYRRGE